MTRKKVLWVLEQLEALYPDAKAELDYTTPFELLVAVILSAQCTDIRVNQVTRVLFEKANTAETLCALPIDVLESIIKPCGLYKTKAKNLHETACTLCKKFNGEVPADHKLLTELPGVGQKTANVVVSNVFDIPAIAVDTHVFRVSNRIGLAKASNVALTEKQLEKAIPKERWSKAHHQLIFLGRRICKARTPLCDQCPIAPECLMYKELTRKKESKHARKKTEPNA